MLFHNNNIIDQKCLKYSVGYLLKPKALFFIMSQATVYVTFQALTRVIGFVS